MQTELWRRVPGYRDYEVSSDDHVRRVKDKRSLKPRPDGGGYFQVALYNKEGRKAFMVHRLVLTVFARPSQEGEQGNHMDGDKSNNAWWNLEWCTAAQNARHARETLHRGAKIALATKTQIRALKSAGMTRRAIAAEMGLLQRSVHSVVAGQKWAGAKS